MVFPGVWLAPLDDEAFEWSKKERTPVPTITATTDTFVVRYPPRDLVQSRYRLQIDVETESETEATKQAVEIANRLLTSLTLSVPGGRFHAEMLKLRWVGSTEEKSAWAQTVNVTPMTAPLPMESDDFDRTLNLFSCLGKDATAENSYIHLLTAWQLQDTAGSKPLQRSILQHYVLSIEAIVTGVMSRVKSQQADQIKLAERKFAENFSVELPKRSDKPKAIRDASTALRMMGLQNMLPAINAVASILAISDDLRDKAQALYKFRSRSLSHPGRTKPKDIDKWLKGGSTVTQICEADVLGRAFLKAYCEWDGDLTQ